MRRGFTLLELLVVMTVIVVLASVLTPVLTRARQGALETTTRSDLRQAWLALEIYREANGD